MAFQENDEDIQFLIFNLTLTTLEYSFAVQFLKALIDTDPFLSEAWYYLCLVYFYNGKIEDALNCIDYAIAIDSKKTDFLIQKSEILINNNQYNDALELLLEANQIENENENILYYIGVCYQNLELYDEARKYYKKCIDIDDSFFDAYEGLADCLYELERYYEAIHYYKNYLVKHLNLEVALKYIDLEIELENFGSALVYMNELSHLITDDYLEIEFILRKTYIDYLKENEFINHILRENFYLEYESEISTSKLKFQSAALSFALGNREIGFFYLENALLKYPMDYEYLYDYNPNLIEDSEIHILINSYKKLQK